MGHLCWANQRSFLRTSLDATSEYGREHKGLAIIGQPQADLPFPGLYSGPRRHFSWLGRQDSNLGMAESKSAYFVCSLNAYSEKRSEFDRLRINRLAYCSECAACSIASFYQGSIVAKPVPNFTRIEPHELDELQGRMVSAMQWTALSFGSLLLLSQAQEATQEGKLIHLAEISCKTFTEFTQQEQAIIISWLQGYNLPEKAPAVINLEKLSSDKAKLTEHCTEKPDDDVMTAAEAVMGQ
jgi:HdeA/HdeB family